MQSHFMYTVKAVIFLGEKGGLLIFLQITHLAASSMLFCSTGKVIVQNCFLVLLFQLSILFLCFPLYSGKLRRRMLMAPYLRQSSKTELLSFILHWAGIFVIHPFITDMWSVWHFRPYIMDLGSTNGTFVNVS